MNGLQLNFMEGSAWADRVGVSKEHKIKSGCDLDHHANYKNRNANITQQIYYERIAMKFSG